MKPSILLLGIAGFGALGAVTRFLLSAWINRLLPTTLPWGTLVVNVLGCLLIGFLVEWDLRSEYFPSHWRVMVGAGFLGALTTFSTFGHETIW
ncbi:MAG: CrcB family protein, partial [Planctomycetales bacterium]|nr:CrcB family protein [Planctomycetales bacterium]